MGCVWDSGSGRWSEWVCVGLWSEGGVVGGVDGMCVGLWSEGGVVGGVDGTLEGGGSGRWSGWDSGGRGEW